MLGFSWAHSAQTVRPQQNSRTKGTSLGCRLAPEMIPIAHKIVPFELHLDHKHPTVDNTHFSCFWDVENPCTEIRKFLHQCTHAETSSRLLFKKWSKLVQDKRRKGHVALKTEKLEMWANAQRDGRPAEYRWRPLLNAAV